MSDWDYDAPICNWHGSKCTAPLSYGPDPYNSEINGDDTLVWMCEEGRDESNMET